MRMTSLIAIMLALAFGVGCTTMTRTRTSQAVVPVPEHPRVRVEGVDGTMITGELLNGTVTVDSQQGPLTLLTEHLQSIAIANDGDRVESQSVTVTGEIRDPEFQIRSEHGLFTLQKDRLKSIEFLRNGEPTQPGTLATQQPQRPYQRATLATEEQSPGRLMLED